MSDYGLIELPMRININIFYFYRNQINTKIFMKIKLIFMYT